MRQFLSDEFFALDPYVQPANTEVDPYDFNISTMHSQKAKMESPKIDEKLSLNGDSDSKDGTEDSYSMGMARKLKQGESGLADVADTATNLARNFQCFGHSRHVVSSLKLHT